MQNRSIRLFVISAVILIFASIAFSQNTIEGTVFDENRVPVDNAYVELYNSLDFMVQFTRTSSQGRFTFRSVPAGRYIVKVKPFGKNLIEDSDQVEFQLVRGGELAFLNFSLRVDKRNQLSSPLINQTVFAQEVPDQARALYESGAEKLNKKDLTGIADLEKAISDFPTYFNALKLLGTHQINSGKFEIGYPFLLRAIDVHQRCGECYYSLAYAFYKLDQIPAAVKAAEAAVSILPTSPDALLLHGIATRINNDLQAAEKSLVAAKTNYGSSPNPEVHWQLALLYNRQKRNELAVKELETYLKLKKDMNPNEEAEVKKILAKLKNQKSK